MPVTCPVALTVTYGTLKVPPWEGVWALASPYEPAVAPELACDIATEPEVPDPLNGELVVIPVMVPALFVNAAQVPACVRAIPVLEVSNVIEDPVILLAAVVSLSTTTSLSPVAIVAVEVILPSLLKLPCV